MTELDFQLPDSGGEKDVRFTVRLPNYLLKSVKRIAKLSDLSPSSLIVNLITQAVNQIEREIKNGSN